MALPRGAMGLSAVCDCGISDHTHLIFLINVKYIVWRDILSRTLSNLTICERDQALVSIYSK